MLAIEVVRMKPHRIGYYINKIIPTNEEKYKAKKGGIMSKLEDMPNSELPKAIMPKATMPMVKKLKW